MTLFQHSVLNLFLLGIDEEVRNKIFNSKLDSEWLDYFTPQKSRANDFKTQIAHTDKEIDTMMYELSEEEKKVVEGGI